MHIVDVIEILPPFSRLDDRLLGSDETKNKVFTLHVLHTLSSKA